MIIDVFGLPGSGKTVWGEYFIEYSKKNNIKIINASKFYDTTVLGRVIKKILFLLIKRNIIYKRIKEHFLSNIAKCNNLYNDEKIDMAINRLLVLHYIYTHFCFDNNIYFFDEGIYHGVLKIATYYDFDEKLLKDLLNKNMQHLNEKNICFIYNCISCDDSMNSIRKRDRHVCSFDDFDDKTLKKYIKKYNLLVSYICNEKKLCQISRYDSIEKRNETVFNYIMEEKK